MKGILGRKVGMTGVFTTSGKLIPVTVISVEPNIVTQIKTKATDGYDSIQLGFETKRANLNNKPSTGHLKKSGSAPKRFLRELRGADVSQYTLGQEIKVDTFEVGEIVDAQGTTKGKGFQGVIKRWNHARGPMSHGSQHHRGVGSLGSMLPKRVLPGKRMPGHMGHETVTIQNLEIIKVDLENNLILVKGSVPGPNKSLIFIKTSVKFPGAKKQAVELVSYKVEPEVVEASEEIKEENEIDEVTETVSEDEAVAETSEETTEPEVAVATDAVLEETEESSQEEK